MATSDTAAGQDAWRPANNGAGKMCWFALRKIDDGHQYHETADGSRLVRFASMASAQKVADRLNAEQS